MLEKIKSMFDGYNAYLRECERSGVQPKSKADWAAERPQKQSC